MVRLGLGARIGNRANQPRRPLPALRAQMAGGEQDDFPPPGVGAVRQRLLDVIVAAGDAERREVFLKGEMRKSVAAFAARDQQAGTLLNQPQQAIDGGIEVARVVQPAGEFVGQQFAQRLAIDFLHPFLVHP